METTVERPWDLSPDHTKLEDSLQHVQEELNQLQVNNSALQLQNKAVKANLAQYNSAMQDQQTHHETQVQEIQHSILNKYQNSKPMQR